MAVAAVIVVVPLLLGFALFNLSETMAAAAAAEESLRKCNSAIERILESNSPQTLVLPTEDEANSFTSSQVRIR